MSEFYAVRDKRATPATPDSARISDLHSRNLQVAMYDVGAGEAIIITAPTGESILVDGGCKRKYTSLGDGLAREIQPGSLTGFVATHPHFDHLGGIQHLLESHRELLAPNATFYEPGTDPVPFGNGKGAWWRKLGVALKKAKVPRRVVSRLIRPQLLGNDVDVALYAGISKKQDYQSVFMHVQFGKAAFLFTGDAYCSYENQLLDKYAKDSVFRAHALKATHHGGQDGTSRRLASAVKPGIAFASTFDDDGHRWETDARGRLPTRCLQLETWDRGDVVLRTDGKTIGTGMLFEEDSRLPGALAEDLKLRGSRPPYESLGKTKELACDETPSG